MEQMRHLVREIHRRSLWQVLTVYVVASWAAYQVVVTLWEGLHLPAWVPPTALVLLIAGLPLVLATAVVQEGGPPAGGADGGGEEEGREPAVAGPGLEMGGRPSKESVAAHGPTSAPPVPDAPGRRLFTWPRTITAIVLGFAVLGIVAAGFVGMRALGIGPAATLLDRGELGPDARVLVADFEAPAGDSLLAGAVAEALRIDLPQSPLLQVVDRSQLKPVLRRMGREPAARVTESVAREAAVREGIPAVLVGDLLPVGSSYQITARLITPDSGRVLFRDRVTAEDAEAVLSAVERLGGRLRRRAGEPLRSVRSSPPLRRVTTPSIEALILYSAAGRANETGAPEGYLKAIRLAEQALALDSTFAMAWRLLGVALGNAGLEPERRVRAFERAVEYEDRLTDEERYATRAAYHADVTGDADRAIDAYERLIELAPDYRGAHNNLGLLYARTGQWEEAAAAVAAGVQRDSTAIALGNLIAYRLSAGDTAGARAALDARIRLYPDNPGNTGHAVRVEYAVGNVQAARDTVRSALGKWHPLVDAQLHEMLAFLDVREGRLSEGRRRMERAKEIWDQEGRTWSAIFNEIEVAWIEYLVAGEEERAEERVRRALRALETRKVPELQSAWLSPIGFLAVAGHADEARRRLDEWRQTVPQGNERRTENLQLMVEAAVARAEGRNEERFALSRRAAQRTSVELYATAFLARGYDEEGRIDSALAAYHRVEAMPFHGRLPIDAQFLANAYERMGYLHEARGEFGEARKYLGRFVDLWKDADPELQPRVEAARRALVRLTREGAHAARP